MKNHFLGLLCLTLLSLFVACKNAPNTSATMATPAPKVAKPADYYTEQHRPQFHFTPESGWMNDPNGLAFYEGEYHYFYQHFPDSTVWGPMHWGHAVSRDLVTWEHLPIALYPDSIGCIFSGSMVVDKNNTSGFGKDGQIPLVAIFTYHNLEWEKAGRLDRESQGIAYSLDKGRTWTKYVGNPVIKNKGDVDFRDPKVFWHEPTKHWIMPLAVGQQLEIFRSANLKNWEKVGEFGKGEGAHGGVWECPDLFPLKNTEGGEKWVLVQNIGRGAVNGGSGTQYFIGQFDGKTFKNDNKPDKILWLDYGADNYAGVTWANAPDNRRILIGWMSNWDDYATKVPSGKWRSAATVPRELSLKKMSTNPNAPSPITNNSATNNQNTEGGYFLNQKPVKELEKLRQNPQSLVAQVVDKPLIINSKAVQKELILNIDLNQTTATSTVVKLSNSKGEFVELGYDKSKNELFVDRRQSGKVAFSKKFPKRHVAPYKAGSTLKLHVLIDATSVEIFADNGVIAMTELFFPNEDFTQTEIFGRGSKVQLLPSEVFDLKNIWR